MISRLRFWTYWFREGKAMREPANDIRRKRMEADLELDSVKKTRSRVLAHWSKRMAEIVDAAHETALSMDSEKVKVTRPVFGAKERRER